MEENLKNILKDKQQQLVDFKKVILKVVVVVILSVFILPYCPHPRIERVLNEKGYWGTVLWGALIMSIVIPIVLYIRYLNIQGEISNIKCEILKREK